MVTDQINVEDVMKDIYRKIIGDLKENHYRMEKKQYLWIQMILIRREVCAEIEEMD